MKYWEAMVGIAKLDRIAKALGDYLKMGVDARTLTKEELDGYYEAFGSLREARRNIELEYREGMTSWIENPELGKENVQTGR